MKIVYLVLSYSGSDCNEWFEYSGDDKAEATRIFEKTAQVNAQRELENKFYKTGDYIEIYLTKYEYPDDTDFDDFGWEEKRIVEERKVKVEKERGAHITFKEGKIWHKFPK